jgi:hypothetical protein
MIGCSVMIKPTCKQLETGSIFNWNGLNFGKGGAPFAGRFLKQSKRGLTLRSF